MPLCKIGERVGVSPGSIEHEQQHEGDAARGQEVQTSCAHEVRSAKRQWVGAIRTFDAQGVIVVRRIFFPSL
jgi:hypothetical protein